MEGKISKSKLAAIFAVAVIPVAAAILSINFVLGNQNVDVAQIVGDHIGPYEVLYIQTPENTPCASDTVIFLRAPESNMDKFFDGSGIDFIQSEMAKLKLPSNVKWAVSGPHYTKEDVTRQRERDTARFVSENHECIRTKGASTDISQMNPVVS